MLEVIVLGHAHVHELAPPRHQLGQHLSLLVDQRRDELGPILVARQHVAEVTQRAGIDLVGLGQHTHGLGEVARLPRIDACDRDARTLQCTHQPALVAPGGLEHHQVDIVFLEFRDQHVPSSRVIDRTQFQRTQADIEMLLAYVDSDVRPVIAIRYPTLRMHVHDGQLFGLHGLDETGRCVDQLLTGELNAHRRIRFGAPTAKTTEARGCGQVDSSSYRSNRPAGRGQRFALPTARASAHLPTASHHDYQDNLRIKLNCLLLEDTRRRGRAFTRIATSIAQCAASHRAPISGFHARGRGAIIMGG